MSENELITGQCAYCMRPVVSRSPREVIFRERSDGMAGPLYSYHRSCYEQIWQDDERAARRDLHIRYRTVWYDATLLREARRL